MPFIKHKLKFKERVASGEWVEWIAFMFVFLTPLMWFRWSFGGAILGEDMTFLFKPPRQFGYSWDDSVGVGRYVNTHIQYAPYFHVLKLMNDALPLWLVEILVVYFFLGLMFLSFRLLMLDILNLCDEQNENVSRIATMAAVFYVFSPYTFYEWYKGHMGFSSLLPLTLLCLLRAMKGMINEYPHRKSFFLLLISAALGFFISGVTFMIPFLLVVFGFSIFLMITHKGKSLKILKTLFIYLILYVLIGLYWFLPLYYGAVTSLVGYYLSVTHNVSIYKMMTGNSTLLELLRLLGYGNFYNGSIPASAFYLTPAVSLVNMALVAISFGSLLLPLKRKSKKFVAFSSLMVIACLFIIKGPNDPFGEVNIFLFERFILFTVLRAPWRYLMAVPILLICILFGFSLMGFSQIWRRRGVRQSSFAISMILLIVHGYPIWSGAIFASHGFPAQYGSIKTTEPYLVSIPWYYSAVGSYVKNSTGSFSVVALPLGTASSCFKWGYMGSQVVPEYFIDKPLTNAEIAFWPDLHNTLGKIVDELLSNPNPKVGRLLYRLFNNKYVLVLHDWDMDFVEYFGSKRLQPHEIEVALNKAGFVFEEMVGNVTIYRNPYWVESRDVYVVDYLSTKLDEYASAEDNLVLELRFDEGEGVGVWDSSGHGNNGTIENSEWTNDDINGLALRLDGVNDYVRVPDHATLNLTTAMTVEVWIKRERTGGKEHLVGKMSWDDYLANRGYDLFLREDQVAFRLGDGISLYELRSDSSIEDTNWHHVVGVLDAATMYVYIDGVKQATTLSFPGSISSSTSELYLGSTPDIALLFNGSIDEFRIYNRALGWLEVEQRYLWGKLAQSDWTDEVLRPIYSVITDAVTNRKDAEALPVITYEKVSPVEYKVHIKEAKDSFYLILAQGYHPEWKLYEGDIDWLGALLRKPLSEDKHFSVNNLANAWLIDKKGSYDLTIYFTVQSYHYVGSIVSALTLGASFVLVVAFRYSKAFTKHKNENRRIRA